MRLRGQLSVLPLLLALLWALACGPASSAPTAPAATPEPSTRGPDPALRAAVLAAAGDGDLDAISALVTAAVDSRPCVPVGLLIEAALEALPAATADQRDALRCLKYAEMRRRRHCGDCTQRGSALGYLASDCAPSMTLHSCDPPFAEHRCPEPPPPHDDPVPPR